MLQYFQPMIDYIQHHPDVGILITFIIAFLESLPLIGTIIPGSVTMTAIGTLIGTGLLPGTITLLWASIGALVGDSIGFAIGYLFTDKIRHMWPFKKNPHWLELSEKFFKKHGGKSIIIGRFIGPARSTVPLVAGLLKMPWSRFIIAAIPSAALWAILYMVPGILLGALALELPPHIATEFILIGLAIIVGLWLIFWALQYFFSRIARLINKMVDNLWDTLIRHKPSRPFIRLIAVKGKPSDHYQLTLTLLCLISTILFFCIFYSVAHNGPLTTLNKPIVALLQSVHTQGLNTFFILFTNLGKPLCMFVIGCLVSIGLALSKQWRAALHFLAFTLMIAGATHFFKIIYHNNRPTGFNYVAETSSFPSGHTAMSMVVLSGLAYFSGKIIKPTLKWLPYALASITILLIALSRLYLAAHWFTDILGSLTLGFSVLFFVLVNYRRKAGKQFQTINKLYWFLMIAFCIFISWAFSIYKNYHFSVYRYTPHWPIVKISMKAWWNDPTHSLPLYRLNRFGKPIQPFNIQWAGKLSDITNHLTKAHWVLIAPKYSVKGTLKRFAKQNKHFHLPLLPWLYHHQPPCLILMKHLTGKPTIVELRLWKSSAVFTDSKLPLWIGTINYHLSPPKKINFTRFKDISLLETGGVKQLISDLFKVKGFQYQFIYIAPSNQPKKIQVLNWDGHLLIIRPTRVLL